MHEQFMKIALEQARKAKGEVPVGAIIVDVDGKIIASAHNQVESKNDCTQHAELLAIKLAAEKRKNWRLDDCSMYVTLEPCTMCIGAILLARISKLYFGCYEPKMGAVGSVYDLSNHSKLPHQVQVFPEILKQECSDLLKGFFSKIRDTK